MRLSLSVVLVVLALTLPAAAQGTIPQPISGQTNLWPVTKIIGVTVYNGQNEAIGKIHDLLMDPQARVATAIVSVGGYIGVGDRLVMVPLDTIRFPKDPAAPKAIYPEKAVLAVTKETLGGMAPFKY